MNVDRSLPHLAGADHWVYEISREGQCLYVGMTNDLARRLREHARLRLWREGVVDITSTKVAGRRNAERLEHERIAALRPTQNRYCIGDAS